MCSHGATVYLYTLLSSPGPNVTLVGRYHCHQGPGITLDKLCDFNADCPLADDEGDLCRHFLNGSYCSFEEGECGWQPVAGRGLSWRRLRNSVCTVRFWLCSGGLQRGSLSLWMAENGTGPEERRRLWHSAGELKSERGWKLVVTPLYGLSDWYGESSAV
ncbi:ALK tyrosine kinase receptor [Liparis tanakae]|uniref:ALK tyrosine kinase receptor n=1 Tax=Liparis tanakae TaxID=230148 RepID=A0A4Z2HWA5_9TELE|nr:ALK tyrosine kinase receptor [Liparis tanakae]